MTRAVTPERQVGRQFVVISLLGFFRTFTGAIVGTGIALFILVHWGSNFLSGVSVAAIAVTYMFSPVLMGRLSDRLGRKMSLEIATTGNLVLSACYVVVVVLVQLGAAWWLIVLIMVLRACEGIFNGMFWPVLQASVGDASSFLPCHDTLVLEKHTRKGMNIYNAGWNGGVLSGQLVLSLFVAVGMLDACLYLPVGLQAVNVILAFVAFKRIDMNGAGAPDTEPSRELVAVRASRTPVQRKVGLMLALAFIFLYGFALGNLSTTTTNLFKARGIAALIGIVEAVRLVMQGVGVSKVELPKKWIGLQLMVVFCALIMVFTVLGLFAGEIINIWVFFVVFGVGGLLFGTIYSEAINMMMINGNEKKRGLLMGVFESFIGIGFFVGPLLAGHLTEVYTYTISYQSVAIIMGPVIVACLVAWLVSRLPRVPGG